MQRHSQRILLIPTHRSYSAHQITSSPGGGIVNKMKKSLFLRSKLCAEVSLASMRLRRSSITFDNHHLFLSSDLHKILKRFNLAVFAFDQTDPLEYWHVQASLSIDVRDNKSQVDEHIKAEAHIQDLVMAHQQNSASRPPAHGGSYQPGRLFAAVPQSPP